MSSWRPPEPRLVRTVDIFKNIPSYLEASALNQIVNDVEDIILPIIDIQEER